MLCDSLPAYTVDDAGLLIKGIRNAIELQIISPRFRPEIIEEQLQKYGSNARIQVRLFHHPTNTQRAFCAREGVLRKAISSAASAIAAGQPGQPPISAKELPELLVEISIFDDEVALPDGAVGRRNAVVLGKDGLKVEYGMHSGMLMPSYPVRNGLSKTGFLEAACESAGLGKDYWKQPKVRIYKFGVQRFIEETPNGRITTG